MASSQPTLVDARGGIVTNIGRDQNYNIINTFNIAIHTGSISQASIHQIIQTVAGAPNVSTSNIRLQVQMQMQSLQEQAVTAADRASGLIVSIVHLLVNRVETSDAYRDWKRFLELLNYTILMTRMVVQIFEHAPLGHNLANTIIPELFGCSEDLQYLFDKLDDYKERLTEFSVRHLWSRVLWNGSEFQELSIIKEKLYKHQLALKEFLVAVNSCVHHTHS